MSLRRRELIAALGGAAAWPLAARAQQRGLGFRDAFEKAGWTDGRNVRIEEHWGAIPAARMRSVTAELVRSSPAVVIASGSPTAEALKLETHTVPVVFVSATDPLASGIVDSMAHPGGNLTGFTNYEFSIGGKWVSLLKDAAPAITRVLVILAPGNIGQQGMLRAIEIAAPALGVEVVPALAETRPELERAIEAFSKQSNGGIVGLPGRPSMTEGDAIVTLAARYRLPTMYTHRYSTLAGRLMSYDTDIPDLWARAAGYVDRILNGEKAGDLPVQLPTKYSLVMNVKTASALGLTLPLSLRAQADEVIE